MNAHSDSPAGGGLFRAERVLACLVWVLLLAAVGAAADGVWTNNSGGNWSDANNWSGGTVADGTNALAEFHTIDITAGRTVTNDVPRTIGRAIFGDANNNQDWTLTGTTLTFAVDAGVPELMVSNRNLNVLCPVGGTNGLAKRGVGGIAFKNKSSDFAGGLDLAGGAVSIYESSLGNTGKVVVVSNGCAITFQSDTATGFTNIYNVYQALAVGTGGAAIKSKGGGSVVVTFPSDNQLTGTDTLSSASDGYGYQIFAGSNPDFGGKVVVGSNALDNGILQINRSDAIGTTNSVELVAAGSGKFASMIVANYSGFNAIPAQELGRFLPTCTGVLSLAADTANAMDFSNAGNLSLASAVAGTVTGGGISVSGTLTAGANNTFRFGGHEATLALAGLLGGDGKLNVDKVLADPGVPDTSNNVFVGYGGLISLNAANTLSGTVVAGPSPDGRTTCGTLYLKNANAVQNAILVSAAGLDVSKYGAILLDPALTYTGPGISLANGAVGWTGSVTLAALPGVYTTNTVVGAAGVTPVKLLHLGGPHSAGTMSQSSGWTIADDGTNAVELVKSGTNSTLDLTGGPVGGNTFTGGVRIAGGTLLFSDEAQLGGGSNGMVQIGQTGVLEWKSGAGSVTWSNKILDSAWSAGGGTADNGAGIKVNPGDKLTVTSVWERGNANRMGFRIHGGGTFEYTPPVLAYATMDNTFTIRLEGNGTTLNMNQLASRRSQVNASSGVIDVKVFSGQTNTFNMLDEPAPPETADANWKTRYGPQQLAVSGTGVVGSAGTFILNVKEGAMFKNDGRLNTGANMVADGATMIVNLEGPNSRFYYGANSAGGVAGSGIGTLVLRGIGTAGWGNVGVAANQRFFGQNVSLVFDGGTWNGGAGYVANGRIEANVTFNQDLDANTDVPKIVSMAVEGAGNTTWNGYVEKIGSDPVFDLWTLSRTGGVVSVAGGAALFIQGGTLSVGGSVDPFTDSVDPAKHLTITNNGVLVIATNGLKHVGHMAGTGLVSVATTGVFGVDTVSPGANSIGMLTVTNAPSVSAMVWHRPDTGTNTFEVNPANTNADQLKVIGTLNLTNTGPNYAIHLGVPPATPVASRNIHSIEIVNATTISGYDRAIFTLTMDSAFPPEGVLQLRKTAGRAGGESLYIDYINNNHVPTAMNDTTSTPVNVAVAIDVLRNDQDADGDPLTISDWTLCAGGVVSGTATNLTYTPNPGWSGADTFQYVVTDSVGGTATGTVIVRVGDVFSLEVSSEHGMSVPVPGMQFYLKDAAIDASVTNDVVIDSGVTQYVCTGWTGTGSVTSGVGTNVTFAITNDSAIAWLWSTNVLFTRVAQTGGTISGDTNGWYSLGGSATVTATADTYYRFGGWAGVPAGQTNENPLTLAMDGTHSITGRFAADLAPLGTPEWWLALHVLTNDTIGFAEAETNDNDGDTVINLHEYIAGTDPTNGQSYLSVVAVSNMPDCRVYFPSVLGRLYDLQNCGILTGGVWSIVSGQSNMPGTGGTLWMVETNAASPKFYRMKVRME